MPTLDLLDRLLEHDAWTTQRVLEFARTLSDGQLDQDFEIGHRTVRETAQHTNRRARSPTAEPFCTSSRTTTCTGPRSSTCFNVWGSRTSLKAMY
jgi:hypothetical protein